MLRLLNSKPDGPAGTSLARLAEAHHESLIFEGMSKPIAFRNTLMRLRLQIRFQNANLAGAIYRYRSIANELL